MQNTEVSVQNEQDLNGLIKIDAAQIQAHLGSIVRESVEETLNKLLDEEADQLCNAQGMSIRRIGQTPVPVITIVSFRQLQAW